MLSPANNSNLKSLEMQCDAHCEEVDCSRERLLASGSKLVAELNKMKAKAASLRSFLDASAALVCCLKRVLALLNATQTEGVQIQLVALLFISSSGWTLCQQEVTV